MILSWILMFGMCYFMGLGIKTKIHNSRCIREEKAAQRAAEYNNRKRKRRTFWGGWARNESGEKVLLLTHRK